MSRLVSCWILLALAVGCGPLLAGETSRLAAASSEDAHVIPGPAVLYLLAESDDEALVSALNNILLPIFTRSELAVLAVSLWQEPEDGSICFQIAWADGELCSGTVTQAKLNCTAQNCPFLLDNPFTFDSDEVYALERLDPISLGQPQSADRSFRTHTPPVFLVRGQGVELLGDESLMQNFVAPLVGEYELPITMISLRLLDADVIHVTVFDGGSSILHAVRVEGVGLEGLTFEEYRRAKRAQEEEHVS